MPAAFATQSSVPTRPEACETVFSVTAWHRRLSHAMPALVLACALPSLAADPAPDPLAPLRALAGQWSGTSEGASGEASVTRRYAWVMGGRYLNEVNISTYPPQDKNRKGERHEHWGMFSHDRARQAIVLRHFHVEGFVNTYRMAAQVNGTLVFESESFENFSNAWRARETYAFKGADEFIETFELAAPGKDFQLYSRTRLTRVVP